MELAAVLSGTDLEACKAVSKAEEVSEASKVDAKKDACAASVVDRVDSVDSAELVELRLLAWA